MTGWQVSGSMVTKDLPSASDLTSTHLSGLVSSFTLLSTWLLMSVSECRTYWKYSQNDENQSRSRPFHRLVAAVGQLYLTLTSMRPEIWLNNRITLQEISLQASFYFELMINSFVLRYLELYLGVSWAQLERQKTLKWAKNKSWSKKTFSKTSEICILENCENSVRDISI